MVAATARRMRLRRIGGPKIQQRPRIRKANSGRQRAVGAALCGRPKASIQALPPKSLLYLPQRGRLNAPPYEEGD